MRIIIVGPGRAGLSLAIAASRTGHEIGAVVGRSSTQVADAADRFGAAPIGLDEHLPPCDLLVLSVRDDAISDVAARVADGLGDTAGAVHLSGLAPVSALDPIGRRSVPTGSFHPLQTLPTPEAGAAALEGSWIALTAGVDLAPTLESLATSLGASSFALADDQKPLYHAAAAAAANFPLAALTIANDLFEDAAVPFEAARPLVEAVIANAFTMGPRAALTGPVARGDVATVAAQADAVVAAEPALAPAFGDFVAELARLTGRSEAFASIIARLREEGSQ